MVPVLGVKMSRAGGAARPEVADGFKQQEVLRKLRGRGRGWTELRSRRKPEGSSRRPGGCLKDLES